MPGPRQGMCPHSSYHSCSAGQRVVLGMSIVSLFVHTINVCRCCAVARVVQFRNRVPAQPFHEHRLCFTFACSFASLACAARPVARVTSSPCQHTLSSVVRGTVWRPGSRAKSLRTRQCFVPFRVLYAGIFPTHEWSSVGWVNLNGVCVRWWRRRSTLGVG